MHQSRAVTPHTGSGLSLHRGCDVLCRVGDPAVIKQKKHVFKDGTTGKLKQALLDRWLLYTVSQYTEGTKDRQAHGVNVQCTYTLVCLHFLLFHFLTIFLGKQ